MITGGVLDAEVVGEPGVLRMQPELVHAACDTAPRAGHARRGARREPLRACAWRSKTASTPLSTARSPTRTSFACSPRRTPSTSARSPPALPFALFDRAVSHATYEQQENGKIVFDGVVEMAKACLARGIPVGLGTDTGCPFITHYDMWRELHYFVKYCGVTPTFALHTATLRNAQLAGTGQGETGSIEEGKCADLIACRENPLEGLHGAARAGAGCARRRAHRAPADQKKMPDVERELDKCL